MKVNTNYTFRTIIEPDEKGTFHGYVPALSGCHTFGATIEETRKNLKDAISIYVSSLIADGEDVPQDNSFESFETITKEERDILKSAENGGFVSVASKKRDTARYSKAAKDTLAKNKTISIRISEADLIKLKAKAIMEGVPYQTLISSSIHKLTVNN